MSSPSDRTGRPGAVARRAGGAHGARTRPGRTLTLEVREAFLKDGFAVTTDVLEGHPAQTIVDYADRSKADLVVVGSRGVAGTERLLLGSVSETVLKYAPCTVLIVHR